MTMKRIAFAAVLAILIAPSAAAAKDGGPATKPVAATPKKVEPKAAAKKAPAKVTAATTKKTEAPKPEVKVTPKKTPKAAPPASQPAKAADKPIKKGEIKTEGKVDIPEGEVKLTPTDDSFSLWDALYGIWTNFKAGKVWDGIALILMVLTFVFFKLKEDLPVKYAVWIAAGLGIATNIVSAIVGGVGWGPALTAGLFQGAAAGGFWTMIGKHIFRSKDEKATREKVREIVEGKTAAGEVEDEG